MHHSYLACCCVCLVLLHHLAQVRQVAHAFWVAVEQIFTFPAGLQLLVKCSPHTAVVDAHSRQHLCMVARVKAWQLWWECTGV